MTSGKNKASKKPSGKAGKKKSAYETAKLEAGQYIEKHGSSFVGLKEALADIRDPGGSASAQKILGFKISHFNDEIPADSRGDDPVKKADKKRDLLAHTTMGKS